MINIAVVEDEHIASDEIVNFIEQYGKNNNIAINTNVFDNAIKFLSGYKSDYDVVFMDIEMPDINGLDAAAKMREVDPDVPLVFVTNMHQYAIKGYSVSALDFIVKPVSYHALASVMNKIVRHIKNREDKEVVIRSERSIIRLKTSSIYYIEVQHHKLIYATDNGKISSWGNLNNIEKELEGEFARCNVSFLVNLRYVGKVTFDEVVVGEEILKMSRSRKKEFLAVLAAFLGRK